MYNSKLLNLILKLNKEELSTFELYLKSPYFVKSKQQAELIKLLALILKNIQKPKGRRLEKKWVYECLYGEEKEVKGKLEKLMSSLLQHILYFISVYSAKEEEAVPLLRVAQFYRNRLAVKQYAKTLFKGGKILDRLNDNNPDHLLQKFLFDKEAYQNQVLLHGSPKEYQFYNQLFSLDAFYLLQKLEYACFFLSHHRFINSLKVDDMVEFLQKIRPLYEKRGLLEVPIIHLFYETFDLLLAPINDEVKYFKLRKSFLEKKKLLPFDYQKSLANYLRNIVIFLYNRGARHLMKELFNRYRSDLEDGYLIDSSGVIPSTFKNVVSLGLRCKAFEWTYSFLNQYKDLIVGTNNPLDVYYFNLAQYYFYKKEFEQALELLTDRYDDIFYKNAAKRLELKVYYETESALLDAKMDAFKIYIYRLEDDAIYPHKRESNNNFINFLRQIRNPKTTYDLKRIEKLEQRIRDCLRLSEREWLLQILEIIKNNNPYRKRNLVKR